jgi:hypothetical protein
MPHLHVVGTKQRDGHGHGNPNRDFVVFRVVPSHVDDRVTVGERTGTLGGNRSQAQAKELSGWRGCSLTLLRTQVRLGKTILASLKNKGAHRPSSRRSA